MLGKLWLEHRSPCAMSADNAVLNSALGSAELKFHWRSTPPVMIPRLSLPMVSLGPFISGLTKEGYLQLRHPGGVLTPLLNY